jgi:hypothetical protein
MWAVEMTAQLIADYGVPIIYTENRTLAAHAALSFMLRSRERITYSKYL